jgi:hypothetical protein
MRRIWIEKSILDVSGAILEGLPPEKAVLFVRTIYSLLHLLGTGDKKSAP